MLPGTLGACFVPGTPFFRFPGTPDPLYVPGNLFPGARTPQFAPGNRFFMLPGAKTAFFAPGRIKISKSEPKKAEIGADRGFETGVSAKNGQIQRRDSFLRQPVGRMCGSVAEGGRVLWDGVVEEEPANDEEGQNTYKWGFPEWEGCVNFATG